MGLTSHPAWVCGLKLYKEIIINSPYQSHPAWVCGLKRQRRLRCDLFVGHTLRGCVDWNFSQWQRHIRWRGHTLRGCVDWNRGYKDTPPRKNASHPAWVCGLKLDYRCVNGCVQRVTPCVGVWIETRLRPHTRNWNNVTPCVGVWIET